MYHQRAVQQGVGDSLVIDVFVMPSIAARRPIAVTIGRYRDGKALVKVQWQLRRPDDAAGSGPALAALFEKVGASAKLAADFAVEVQRFMGKEAAHLETVLATLTKPAR